jgi:Uma2 family endonuclease
MTTPTRLMTAEEFGQRPDRDDGCREEPVAGVVQVAPPVEEPHGDIQFNIAEILRPFVRQHRLGKVRGEARYRVAADPDYVPGPDASFMSRERAAQFPKTGTYRNVALDLAIEIISPSNRADGMHAKVQRYLAGGSRRVWVLYPETRSLIVHRDDGNSHTYTDDDVVTSDDAGFEAKGFEARVSAFFEDID